MKTTLTQLTRAWTSSQDVPGNSAVTYYQLQQVLLLSAPLRFLQYTSSSAVFTSTAPSSKFCNGPTSLLVWVPSPLHHSEDHLFKICNGSKIAAAIFLLRGGTTWTGTDPELQVWICWHRFLRDSAPHFFTGSTREINTAITAHLRWATKHHNPSEQLGLVNSPFSSSFLSVFYDNVWLFCILVPFGLVSCSEKSASNNT